MRKLVAHVGADNGAGASARAILEACEEAALRMRGRRRPMILEVSSAVVEPHDDDLNIRVNDLRRRLGGVLVPRNTRGRCGRCRYDL